MSREYFQAFEAKEMFSVAPGQSHHHTFGIFRQMVAALTCSCAVGDLGS